MSRRTFIKQSSALLGGATLVSAFDNPAFSLLKNKFPLADQVNIGAIGINGMGWANVVAALKVPGVNLVAVCDADKNVMEKRLGEYTAKGNGDASKVKRYSDYRKLLEQKDIDAVIIGTPDHWHALMMIDACAAGKVRKEG